MAQSPPWHKYPGMLYLLELDPPIYIMCAVWHTYVHVRTHAYGMSTHIFQILVYECGCKVLDRCRYQSRRRRQALAASLIAKRVGSKWLDRGCIGNSWMPKTWECLRDEIISGEVRIATATMKRSTWCWQYHILQLVHTIEVVGTWFWVKAHWRQPL